MAQDMGGRYGQELAALLGEAERRNAELEAALRDIEARASAHQGMPTWTWMEPIHVAAIGVLQTR